MKVLLLGSSKSVYTNNLASNLIALDVEVELLDCKKLIHVDYVNNTKKKLNSILPNIDGIPKLTNINRKYALRRFINNLKTKYDICNIHSINTRYIPLLDSILSISNYLVATVWGSDYFRASKKVRESHTAIYDLADRITFNNEEAEKDFQEFYRDKYRDKTCIYRFGLTILDAISKIKEEEKRDLSKEKMGFRRDDVIVTCGYNAKKSQQHEAVIRSISSVSSDLPGNVVFAFPITYGDRELIPKIEKLLRSSEINYHVFKEFMSEEDVARLRLISDVMVHVQITDQLSGSMQEAMFAENLIITGDWLPYKIFESKGAVLFKVSSADGVGPKIADCLKNYDDYKETCKLNQPVVSDMASWGKNARKWKMLYEDLCSH